MLYGVFVSEQDFKDVGDLQDFRVEANYYPSRVGWSRRVDFNNCI